MLTHAILMDFPFRIHTNSKEYGFGQSLLHEGQLVFHTPPYSLQPVSLQECHESYGKANIRIARPDVDQKSPLVQHKTESPHSTATGVAAAAEKPYPKIKAKEMGSPATLERKNRRFSYGNSRATINSHEVPYARLLDSPSRIAKGKDAIDPKISPTPSARQLQQQQPLHQDASLNTPKSLRIPTPKTSSSDSKLTVEYNCPESMEPVSFERPVFFGEYFVSN